jgi:hypothetical protein
VKTWSTKTFCRTSSKAIDNFVKDVSFHWSRLRLRLIYLQMETRFPFLTIYQDSCAAKALLNAYLRNTVTEGKRRTQARKEVALAHRPNRNASSEDSDERSGDEHVQEPEDNATAGPSRAAGNKQSKKGKP